MRFALCVLGVLGTGVCAWCGNFRRLPARKMLVVVDCGFGWMICVSGLNCFVDGVNVGEVGSDSIPRFGLWLVKDLRVVVIVW